MMLRNAIHKLVELVDKVANIDTAHGVRLRERHRLRKALPEPLALAARSTYIAKLSASPVASQQTPTT